MPSRARPCARSAQSGEDCRNKEMLVLQREQVSPFGIERALQLHAWSGHASAATAPCEEGQCG